MEHSVLMQRIEAGFVFVACVLIYIHMGYNFLYFVLTLLLIDAFMAGYLVNKRLGAYVYNLGHSFIIPSSLIVMGIIIDSNALIGLCLIWTAHIGMDRALGYGLKRETAFTDTHLGKIGKN